MVQEDPDHDAQVLRVACSGRHRPAALDGGAEGVDFGNGDRHVARGRWRLRHHRRRRPRGLRLRRGGRCLLRSRCGRWLRVLLPRAVQQRRNRRRIEGRLLLRRLRLGLRARRCLHLLGRLRLGLRTRGGGRRRYRAGRGRRFNRRDLRRCRGRFGHGCRGRRRRRRFGRRRWWRGGGRWRGRRRCGLCHGCRHGRRWLLDRLWILDHRRLLLRDGPIRDLDQLNDDRRLLDILRLQPVRQAEINEGDDDGVCRSRCEHGSAHFHQRAAFGAAGTVWPGERATNATRVKPALWMVPITSSTRP